MIKIWFKKGGIHRAVTANNHDKAKIIMAWADNGWRMTSVRKVQNNGK